MNIDLIDSSCELCRHFFGQRRFNKGEDRPFAAVATDHVVESFRNELWPGC